MASSDPSKRPRPGPWPPAPESAPAMPPSSWAKRTGFRPKFSGEANASDSGSILPRSQPKPKEPDASIDIEAGRVRPGPTSNGEPAPLPPKPTHEKDKEQSVRKRRDSDGGGGAPPAPATKAPGANGQQAAAAATGAVASGDGASRRGTRNEEVVDVLPQILADDDGFVSRHSHMKYELRDTPGLGELWLLV